MSAVQFRLWPPHSHMKKRLLSAIIAIGAVSAAAQLQLHEVQEASDAQPASPQAVDAMSGVIEAMLLSQRGGYMRAAEMLAAAAEENRDPALMGQAVRDAHAAANPARVLEYAQRWEALGGGMDARREQARALLAMRRFDEAGAVLVSLKADGDEGEQLYEIIRRADREQAAALGRTLFDADSAQSAVLLARAELAAGHEDAAAAAMSQGLSQGEHPELYLIRMWIAQRRGNEAALPAQVYGYVARGCPALSEVLKEPEEAADSDEGGEEEADEESEEPADDETPETPAKEGEAAEEQAEEEDSSEADQEATQDACEEARIFYALRLYNPADPDRWRDAFSDDLIVEEDAALAAGEILEAAGEEDRAYDYYLAAERQFEARMGLARIARKRGELQNAIDILDGADVNRRAEYVRREIVAADIMEELHGAPAALARIVAAYATAPDNPELMQREALVRERAGDFGGAIGVLERMVQAHPNNAEGWNSLGYLLADRGLRLDEAEGYIRKALALRPGAAHIIDSLGWVYYRQGRLQEARAYLLEATQKSPSAEIAAHLGEVHWQLGEREMALRVFERGREEEPDNPVLNETLRRLRIDI